MSCLDVPNLRKDRLSLQISTLLLIDRWRWSHLSLSCSPLVLVAHYPWRNKFVAWHDKTKQKALLCVSEGSGSTVRHIRGSQRTTESTHRGAAPFHHHTISLRLLMRVVLCDCSCRRFHHIKRRELTAALQLLWDSKRHERGGLSA